MESKHSYKLSVALFAKIGCASGNNVRRARRDSGNKRVNSFILLSACTIIAKAKKVTKISFNAVQSTTLGIAQASLALPSLKRAFAATLLADLLVGWMQERFK